MQYILQPCRLQYCQKMQKNEMKGNHGCAGNWKQESFSPSSDEISMGDAKSLFMCINAEPPSFWEGRDGNVKICNSSNSQLCTGTVEQRTYSIPGSELDGNHKQPKGRLLFFFCSCFYL